MFVLAVVLYDETLQPEKMLTFALIWLALIIYSVDTVVARNKQKTLIVNQ
jgi:chloramphenicol-sensitive protein RarD